MSLSTQRCEQRINRRTPNLHIVKRDWVPVASACVHLCLMILEVSRGLLTCRKYMKVSAKVISHQLRHAVTAAFLTKVAPSAKCRCIRTGSSGPHLRFLFNTASRQYSPKTKPQTPEDLRRSEKAKNHSPCWSHRIAFSPAKDV